MYPLRKLLAAAISLAFCAAPALAASPNVVTTIKPVDSLVSAVMQGAGTPYLIVKGAASPHTYALKPSDAVALQGAGLIFRDSPVLENFLNAALSSVPRDASVVTLAAAPGVTGLPLRTSGTFEADPDAQPAPVTPGAANDPRSGLDPHVWLDPVNAKAMVTAIADALSKADPDNAALYAANAERERQKLDRLVADLTNQLAPLKGKPFIVFHDAYHYFEARFGLHAAGSVVVEPGIVPGARRVAEIRDKVSALGATCVFTEPEFQPGLVDTILEGTGARKGTLDPLGAELTPGPDLYFTLLRDMANNLEACLEPPAAS